MSKNSTSVLGDYKLLSKCRSRGVRLKACAEILPSRLFGVLVVGHRRAVGRRLYGVGKMRLTGKKGFKIQRDVFVPCYQFLVPTKECDLA